ncbi:MAG: hypothetical protein KC414_12045, partial [Romboutsia sp.]|nr:hypothetical protein [Romboutsia sp.]
MLVSLFGKKQVDAFVVEPEYIDVGIKYTISSDVFKIFFNFIRFSHVKGVEENKTDLTIRHVKSKCIIINNQGVKKFDEIEKKIVATKNLNSIEIHWDYRLINYIYIFELYN